ncbi:MAG: metal-sulfur cluster assembly factor [Trueperaceae bacterium]|nr:metal-sulfur cluster assembly factor [Trueperaceae bacterium]
MTTTTGLEQAVWSALRHVIDPELGMDVVALGLVYGVTVDEGRVAVDLTLTTPGCPLHETTTEDALRHLERLPGVRAVDVRLVWSPPWTPDRMSPEAHALLYGRR